MLNPHTLCQKLAAQCQGMRIAKFFMIHQHIKNVILLEGFARPLKIMQQKSYGQSRSALITAPLLKKNIMSIQNQQSKISQLQTIIKHATAGMMQDAILSAINLILLIIARAEDIKDEIQDYFIQILKNKAMFPVQKTIQMENMNPLQNLPQT